MIFRVESGSQLRRFYINQQKVILTFLYLVFVPVNESIEPNLSEKCSWFLSLKWFPLDWFEYFSHFIRRFNVISIRVSFFSFIRTKTRVQNLERKNMPYLIIITISADGDNHSNPCGSFSLSWAFFMVSFGYKRLLLMHNFVTLCNSSFKTFTRKRVKQLSSDKNADILHVFSSN